VRERVQWTCESGERRELGRAAGPKHRKVPQGGVGRADLNCDGFPAAPALKSLPRGAGLALASARIVRMPMDQQKSRR